VDSAIVRLVPLPAARPMARDDTRFAALVTAGFGQRRKTLGNTLKPFMPVEAILAQGINPKRRGETLSVADFIALADASMAFPPERSDAG
jgi:16S rRNA (adenine1518-N6/adenine1519-N6)-dimethyltransferase